MNGTTLREIVTHKKILPSHPKVEELVLPVVYLDASKRCINGQRYDVVCLPGYDPEIDSGASLWPLISINGELFMPETRYLFLKRLLFLSRGGRSIYDSLVKMQPEAVAGIYDWPDKAILKMLVALPRRKIAKILYRAKKKIAP